jgi:hypothetical protein
MKKRKIRLPKIKNNKNNGVKIRTPMPPPGIRHNARKGTGYNRRTEKKEFSDELREMD